MSSQGTILIALLVVLLTIVRRAPDWVVWLTAIVFALAALLPDQVRNLAMAGGIRAGEHWPWYVMAASGAAALAAGRNEPNQSLIRSFLAFAFVCGLGYALILPPMQVPDEAQHLLRAYQTLDGRCVAPPSYDYPQPIGELIRAFPPAIESRRQLLWDEVDGWYAVPASDGRIESIAGNTGDLYHCLTYLPQAAGIVLSRATGASVMGLLVAARIAGLACYLALVWIAWSLLPAGRMVFLAIAGMPMALHQSAGVTADTLSNGLCFVLVAYVVRLAWSSELVGPKQIAALVALSIAVALAKMTFWLALATLLITAARFAGRMRKAAVVSACVGAALAATGVWNWANFDKVQLIGRNRIERGVDVQKNLEFSRTRPLELAGAVLRTVEHRAPEWTEMFVGRLGFGSIRLPSSVIVLYVLVLLFLAATGFRDVRLQMGQCVFAVVWTAAGSALLLVLLFHLETPANVLAGGVPEIPGFQGRYWIPFALLFSIALGGFVRVPGTIRIAALAAGLLISNAAALATMENRYYSGLSERPRMQLLPDVQIDNRLTGQPAPPLPSSVRLGQAFRSEHNGLAAVDVLFATYTRIIPAGFVTFTLRSESAEGPVVAESRVPANRIRDNTWDGIRFERLPDSKGKLYFLVIGVEDLPREYALTLWLGPANLHLAGDFYVNGKAAGQDCAFRTYYQP